MHIYARCAIRRRKKGKRTGLSGCLAGFDLGADKLCSGLLRCIDASIPPPTAAQRASGYANAVRRHASPPGRSAKGPPQASLSAPLVRRSFAARVFLPLVGVFLADRLRRRCSIPVPLPKKAPPSPARRFFPQLPSLSSLSRRRSPIAHLLVG